MKSLTRTNRRDFLKLSTLAAGALVIGFHLKDEAAAEENGVFHPNAWLEITPANDVIIHVPWSELGQGALTSVPLLLADELEVDWDVVQVRKAWNDPRFGNMGTGGSRSVRTSWDPVRRAGASARLMLIEAAANLWQVPASDCRAEAGTVVGPAGDRLTYGELAGAARDLAVPTDPPLKSPQQRRLISHSVPTRTSRPRWTAPRTSDSINASKG